MLKEKVIFCYLLLFRVVFAIFKLSPQKQKVTIVTSFEENAWYLHQEMVKQKVPFKVIFYANLHY